MRYVCDLCGWEYDEDKGDEELDIVPGTRFDELPADFVCPLCGAEREEFSSEED